jgi:HEAT repeat protein
MLRLGSESVPCLIGALKHDDAQVRASAAYSLGEIGQSAKKSVPSLVEALQDKEEIVRAEAAIALVQIDPKEANKVNAERFIPPRGPFVAQPPRTKSTP